MNFCRVNQFVSLGLLHNGNSGNTWFAIVIHVICITTGPKLKLKNDTAQNINANCIIKE